MLRCRYRIRNLRSIQVWYPIISSLYPTSKWEEGHTIHLPNTLLNLALPFSAVTTHLHPSKPSHLPPKSSILWYNTPKSASSLAGTTWNTRLAKRGYSGFGWWCFRWRFEEEDEAAGMASNEGLFPFVVGIIDRSIRALCTIDHMTWCDGSTNWSVLVPDEVWDSSKLARALEMMHPKERGAHSLI